MTKIYAINNTTEASYKFQVGSQKLYVKCVFTNGTVNRRKNVPAQLVTNNPIVMRAIEGSQLFKNGRIYILQQTGDESDVKAETVPVASEAPAAQYEAEAPATKEVADPSVPEAAQNPGAPGGEYPEVTKHGEAVTILMQHGIPVSQCKNIEDTLAAAASVGVSFPNLKARR